MNDSRDEIRALWCRQVSAEELNEADGRLLRDALREDPDLRRELSDDATSHALLSSSEDVVQTEDSFVQAVMQQTIAVSVAPTPAINSAPPLASGQVAVEPDRADSSERRSPELPMVEDGRHSDRRQRGRRHSQQRVSFLLTFVLFLAMGLFFWFQGQGQQEIAGTGPFPNEQDVEPKPEIPLQSDSPESVSEQNVAAIDDMGSEGSQPSEDTDDPSPLVAANENTATPSAPEDNVEGSKPPNMAEETPPLVASQSFATLTKLENPVWEREDSVGSRLGDEVVRLFGGTVQLTFDDGAVVTLEAPVEFQPLTAGQLSLRRGQLSATVPKPAIGFTVVTPTSEVVDLGTEFDVSVKDTGASDVVIRKGEVEVAPSGRTGKDVHTWKLVPGGLNHASFYARPDDGKRGAIVAKVEGARGQFHGIISLDGKTAKFRSEDTFNNVHERVMTQLKNPQDGMQRQWQDFVNSMQQQVRGSMSFNGRQMQFGNLDEVMRLHIQLQNKFNIDAEKPFSGSININGKVIEFKTREEFEAARRTAFGPAANFGAGDVFDRRNPPR